MNPSREKEHKRILEILRRGKLSLQGQFMNSSNYTFLVTAVYGGDELVAVYKPTRGATPLWDFEAASLPRREVAAYVVSEALGWELVPVTVFRRRAPLGSGSLQQFIEHDPEYHYFKFTSRDRERLRPAVVFDYLVNNADRKGGHILRDDRDRLWLIDHGICFHEEFKLRTVLWDFVGEEIPTLLLEDIERFLHEITHPESPLYRRLCELLSEREIFAMAKRADHLLKIRTFPEPEKFRRPFPYPPV